MNIREVRESDVDAIVTIYNSYIETTTITFEEVPVTADIMKERMKKVAQSGFPWLIVEEGGQVLGYAYASPWKARSAYRFSVEPSIYLAPEYRHQGLGKTIYRELLNRLQHLGIKNVLGVIALPNAASTALHESLGFKKVGEFPNIGFKLNRWVAVGYWQLELADQ